MEHEKLIRINRSKILLAGFAVMLLVTGAFSAYYYAGKGNVFFKGNIPIRKSDEGNVLAAYDMSDGCASKRTRSQGGNSITYCPYSNSFPYNSSFSGELVYFFENPGYRPASTYIQIGVGGDVRTFYFRSSQGESCGWSGSGGRRYECYGGYLIIHTGLYPTYGSLISFNIHTSSSNWVGFEFSEGSSMICRGWGDDGWYTQAQSGAGYVTAFRNWAAATGSQLYFVPCISDNGGTPSYDFNDWDTVFGIYNAATPMSVSINPGPSCPTGADFPFVINAVKGSSDINRAVLTISGTLASGGAYSTNINMNVNWAGVQVTVTGYPTAPLNIGSGGISYSFSGNNLTITIPISGLTALTGNTVDKATIYNVAGQSVEDSKTFNITPVPNVSLNIDPTGSVSAGQTITLYFSISSAAATCSLGCSVVPPASVSCPLMPSISCPPVGGSASAQVTMPTSSGSYTLRFSFTANAFNSCGSNSDTQDVTVTAANPWYMTGWGDAYAYEGYIPPAAGMTMWNLTTQPFTPIIPVGASNTAYFSTYIISKNTNNFPTRTSSASYTLDNYLDANRILPEGVGSFDIYNYLLELAKKNGCNYKIAGPINCSVDDPFYIINGPVIMGNDVIRPSGNGCTVVSSGNVTIDDGVSQLDVLFASNGTFGTGTGGTRYSNNGSVLARNVSFGRSLADNASNPAELIYYDPKYLDLLRECFGEYNVVTIREYKYSEAE